VHASNRDSEEEQQTSRDNLFHSDGFVRESDLHFKIPRQDWFYLIPFPISLFYGTRIGRRNPAGGDTVPFSVVLEVSFLRLCSLLFGLVFIPFSFYKYRALIPSYTRRSRQEHEKGKYPRQKIEVALGRQDGRTSCVWFNSRARVRNCQTRVWRCCC